MKIRHGISLGSFVMEFRYGISLWNFVFRVSPREFVIRFRNFVRDVQNFLLEFRDGRWEIWFGLVGLVYFEKFARGVSFDKLEFRPRCTVLLHRRQGR